MRDIRVIRALLNPYSLTLAVIVGFGVGTQVGQIIIEHGLWAQTWVFGN